MKNCHVRAGIIHFSPQAQPVEQQGHYAISLTGQSHEIFDLHFLHYSILPGPLTNGWVKTFSILFKISQSYWNFRLKKLTCRGMTPRGD